MDKQFSDCNNEHLLISNKLSSTEDRQYIASARTPVHYPWWIHILASLVFLVNCSKIPRSIQYIQNNASKIMPQKGEITTSDIQAATIGSIVICLISGIVGTLVIYFLFRGSQRKNNNSTQNNRASRQKNDLWLFIVSPALLFPDLWFAITGLTPYTSWQFLSIFTIGVILLTIWKGQLKIMPAALPIALLLGFIL